MTLLEEVEVKLRDAILNGEYRPGERLIEGDLTQRYRVSRSVLREALRNLGGTGIVTYYPNKGHHVTKFTIKQVENIYDVITLLQGYACELSVPFFKQRDIDFLKALNQQMKGLVHKQDYRAYRKLNDSFHEKFSIMSGNEVLRDTITKLRTRAFTYRYLAVMVPNAMEGYCKEHDTIINGVVMKDTRRTKMGMQRHMQTVKNNLIPVLKQSPLA